MTYRVPTLPGPVDAVIRPPGSKSETIRALTAAALAEGRSHLYSPLEADDPWAMAGALHALGVDVATDSDPWAVDGRGGRLEPPQVDLDANESGLSARILVALAGSLDGASRIVGRGRLPERPMGGIAAALRGQGVEVDGERLPIVVSGRGHLWGGRIEVDCSHSSQFATAVMLVAPTMHEPCILDLKGLSGSAAYLEGTASIMRRFGVTVERTVTGFEISNQGYLASDVVIEPDASAAVYPMAVAAITGGIVKVEGVGQDTWQPDMKVADVLNAMGCEVSWEQDVLEVDARHTRLLGIETDMSDAPDGSLALAVVCLFADGPSRISGLGSLRHKESDRLEAISSELRRIGGGVAVDGDALVITPGDLHGAEIDPHGDHRIAMAMATAGTRLTGLSVSAPAVVNKTWPGYWEMLETLDTA
ncbi:MAG TPA: 3-phosphoshikimate 1-carboxyvinyltransferase [Acidimicrobiia bacterium]|nr:3-phosphoshikimate 1-carboxyvinyltransferase [Acidimicrobiia bacterium]